MCYYRPPTSHIFHTFGKILEKVIIGIWQGSRRVRKLSFEDKIHGAFKAYNVAHKILYQDQLLFLAFWLRKWHFFFYNYTPKNSRKWQKKGDKKLKNDL